MTSFHTKTDVPLDGHLLLHTKQRRLVNFFLNHSRSNRIDKHLPGRKKLHLVTSLSLRLQSSEESKRGCCLLQRGERRRYAARSFGE